MRARDKLHTSANVCSQKLLNTQDYLIAQGAGKLPPGQLPRTALKYSFSQDGVKWIDLEALSDDVVSKVATITGMLSGEPAKSYTIQEPGAPPAAEGEVRLAVLTCMPFLLLSMCKSWAHQVVKALVSWKCPLVQ